MSTYEIIRDIPAKGFDWAGFNAALRALVVEANAAPHEDTFAEWDSAKGMRAIRIAAMEMANLYAFKVSSRQHIIPPSDESKMWDSFEGGHNLIWNDAAALEAAAQEIAALAAKFRE
jgi:hypothetical protein